MKNIFTVIGILFLLLLTSYKSDAQNISTEGKDFWVAFMRHENASAPFTLSVYVSSKDTVNGFIDFPPGAGTDQSFTISPNSTVEFTVNKTAVSPSNQNAVQNLGIHITTDEDVSVYAVNRANVFSADATVVLPTVTLGKKYIVTSYDENYAGGGATGRSEAVLLGVEDGTTVQITPSVSLSSGRPAGTPFNITLNQGQTFLLVGSAGSPNDNDLTGTIIETLGGSAGDCKNFAVYSGNSRTPIGGGCSASQDNLYQQMYPVNTWGQTFTFVPYQDRTGGDLLKLVAAEDDTEIQVTGQASIFLDEGDSRTLTLNAVSTVNADKPISATQFAQSAGCSGSGIGDPFMISLSPNEQLLRQITFNAFPIFPSGFTYYIDMICPTDGVDGMRLDGSDISGDFQIVPSNPSYSYAQLSNISDGNHTIVSDSGFVAYVYGFGSGASDFESFGFATGASLDNINLTIEPFDANIIGVSTPDSICFENLVDYSVDIDTAVFKFFTWDMGDGTIYNTKDISHRYRQDYDGADTSYIVEFRASTSLGDCGNEEVTRREVTVIKPSFDFVGPTSVCPNTSGILYGVYNQETTNQHIWSVGGGALVSGQNQDTIVVDWGGANANAFVETLTTMELGCKDTFTYNVVINNQLEPLAPLGEDSVCYSALTQKYEAFFASGNAYDWFAEGGIVMADASNTNGNSTFVVWDPDATEHFVWFNERNILDVICAGTSDTLNVNILPEIIGVTSTVDAFCFGGNDGEADIVASGGLDGILSYEWLHDATLTTTSITGLPAGIYQVEVTDGVGCTAIFADTVNQPDSITIDVLVDKEVCFGESDATITANVSNGTRPYSYNWIGSSSTDSLAAGLAGGLYSLTITDANNCSQTVSDIPVIERPDVLFSINAIDSACHFSTVEYIADSPEYIYSWVVTGGSIVSNNNDTIIVEWSGVNATGNINVLASDTAGCNSQIDVPINVYDLEPAIPQGREKVCLNDIANVSYQTPLRTGYDYVWIVEGGTIVSNNINTVNIAWDAAATSHKVSYQLVAQNDVACNELSPELIIELQPELNADVLKKDVTCFGEADGWISLNTSGGVGSDYTFNWAHDASLTEDSISSLIAGTYTVTISDTAGCQIIEAIEIIDPSAPMAVQNVSITNSDCFGIANGAIDVTIQGGTPSYSYQWDDTTLPLSNQLNNILAGTYTLTITDANSCTIDTAITVIEPDRYLFSLQGEDSVCYGELATYTAVDSGYQSYIWTPTDGTVLSGQGTLQATIQWDSVQNHTLGIVIDNNGCLADTTVEIFSSFLEADLVAVNPTCFGFSDGTVEAVVSGNSSIYNYDWSPTSSVDTSTIRDLPIGNYSVVITNLEGCSITRAVTLTQADTLVIDSLIAIDLVCNAEPTGEIEVAVQGGQTPYAFLWNDSLGQITSRASQLLAGAYTVVVTDSLGCVANRTIEIIEPPILETVFNATSTVCDYKNGTVSVDVSGATPPYSYEWLNASVSPSFANQATGLLPDSNTVTITDANGCVYDVRFNVPYEAPKVEFANAFTPNDDDRNETFGPVITCDNPIQYEFKILDRWGNVVFYSKTVGDTWNGDFNSKPMPSGIYPYYIYYLIELDGVVYEEKKFGSVLLIR